MFSINDKITDNERHYITQREAKEFKKILTICMTSYSKKEEGISDKEWLKKLFKEMLPEMTEDEAEAGSQEVFEKINKFDANLKSINEAVEVGMSKELWLAGKLTESKAGIRVNEYVSVLQYMHNLFYLKNAELHEALTHKNSGYVRMNRIPGDSIPVNMLDKTTNLNTFYVGKKLKVEIRDFLTPNSVDFRVVNLFTGEYIDYQFKFGETVEDTINLINTGSYSNQRLIVPREQLEEIRRSFPTRTIEDHMEVWGYKGKKFTKKNMNALEKLAQEGIITSRIDNCHYQTKDLAISIGKNAGIMALQIAAATAGLNIAEKIVKNEQIKSEDIVQIALETGADTGLKVITAGVLQIAIRKGIISFIPNATPAGVIDNIAWVGIENLKILWKIAAGDLSVSKGLDQMGKVTVSVVGGLWAMAEGEAIGAQLTAWIPVVGLPLSIITGFIGGMVGYFGGSKINEAIYDTGKKVRKSAKSMASSAWDRLKSKVTIACKKIISLLFS